MSRKFAAAKQTAAFLAVALGLTISVVAPAAALTNRVTVSMQNNSSYDIYRLYMSSSGISNWGRDLLGSRVFSSGTSFAVTADPGKYDLKLVDEDGDTCTVMGLSVYANASWNINDRWLLSCEFH